jgi:hypothetical protein
LTPLNKFDSQQPITRSSSVPQHLHLCYKRKTIRERAREREREGKRGGRGGAFWESL